MASTRKLCVVVHAFAAAAAILAACGGESGAGGGVDGGSPGAPAVCTGPVPANATLCPGADSNLTSDAPRVVAGSSCACAPPCTLLPCSYACNAGYALSAQGGCVSEPASPPAAAFRDNGDGTVTVTDDLGEATWLKNANCTDSAGGVERASGSLPWSDAMQWSSGLAAGACGLRDGSQAGAWQLPTQVQLMHLEVELPSGSPFQGVQSGDYWSSWTYWTDQAGAVDMYSGDYFNYPKTSLFYVWPVRH